MNKNNKLRNKEERTYLNNMLMALRIHLNFTFTPTNQFARHQLDQLEMAAEGPSGLKILSGKENPIIQVF